jgi:hypothetical protein
VKRASCDGESPDSLPRENPQHQEREYKSFACNKAILMEEIGMKASHFFWGLLAVSMVMVGCSKSVAVKKDIGGLWPFQLDAFSKMGYVDVKGMWLSRPSLTKR